MPKTGCTHYLVKRAKKGGRLLPKAQWKLVTRCAGRKRKASKPSTARKASGGKRCRAGGANWKAEVRANFERLDTRTKAGKTRALAPARFVRCR